VEKQWKKGNKDTGNIRKTNKQLQKRTVKLAESGTGSENIKLNERKNSEI
jgi:hypothetical protein